jgi:hypothetical protein
MQMFTYMISKHLYCFMKHTIYQFVQEVLLLHPVIVLYFGSGDRCYDYLQIFAEKFLPKNWRFLCSKQR